jgi:hypothetical protein
MPALYAELEIALTALDARTCLVEMRATQPGDDGDKRPLGAAPRIELDFDALRALTADAAAYGRALARAVFTDPIKTFFVKTRAAAQSANAPLRVRLLLDPRLAELHRLRWETLRDPEDEAALFTGENVLCARYLSSLDWRPVAPRAQAQWRVLAAAANPRDLAQYRLEPVDAAGELDRVRAALGATPLEVAPPTLEGLIAQLRAAPEVLYLVCHGRLTESGDPLLLLEKADGTTDRVKGMDLVDRLRDLAQLPLLVVLAACQSADAGVGDALVALGPRLAEAGVPTVIAMQGQISMETITAFMPVFFSELARDGQIDRAMAVARGAIRARPDHWMPVLFMRLRSGRLWYEPRMVAASQHQDQWVTLLRAIQRGECTPLLGPGLADAALGPQPALARAWAEAHGYPLAPHGRDDLPAVAQYLATRYDLAFVRDEINRLLEQCLRDRHSAALGATALHGLPLAQLFTIVGQHLRASPADPHRVLAQLPCPVFVTANADLLLEEALREQGKRPHTQVCVWRRDIETLAIAADPAAEPTAQTPLVFHLFGLYDYPKTLVLTEDDFLDYVINIHLGRSDGRGQGGSVSRRTSAIPLVVRERLTDAALLFVGFQSAHLSFRVLFRTIWQTEGREALREHTHVTAQMYPDELHHLDPALARRYFEKYFQQANAGIYWGAVDDFAKALAGKL